MNDTIAAISTGTGPIGIIRLSGEHAIAAANAIFTPFSGAPLADRPTQTLVYGSLRGAAGQQIDCCYGVVFRAPHTYTGEDMAEIQCHGSAAILQETLTALFQQGVRQAGPGEFTRRAFLNGKLDLSGAEAVGDLIAARTAEAAQNAAAQLQGAVGGRIRAIRDKLLSIVAHFHAVVDFPDEDIDPFLFEQAAETLHAAASALYHLAESYERGRVLREGVPCVILGRPNAGKSSLLNALLGRERAIVTDVPGTTRDIIEESVRLGPVLLRLSDTAGLRDTTDPIEKEGIERAFRASDAARLILALFDGSVPLSDDDLLVMSRAADHPAIAVVNKTDLPPASDLALIRRNFTHVVTLSAKTGEGLDELTRVIQQMVGFDESSFNGELITNARQAAAMARAAERCEEAFYAAQSGMTPDAVVMDAEGAIAALGEITGQSVTDDVVAKIFGSFCVGK